MVEVSVPSFMVMLESLPVETVVGSHLQAAVAMKSSTGIAKSIDIRFDAAILLSFTLISSLLFMFNFLYSVFLTCRCLFLQM